MLLVPSGRGADNLQVCRYHFELGAQQEVPVSGNVVHMKRDFSLGVTSSVLMVMTGQTVHGALCMLRSPWVFQALLWKLLLQTPTCRSRDAMSWAGAWSGGV